MRGARAARLATRLHPRVVRSQAARRANGASSIITAALGIAAERSAALTVGGGVALVRAAADRDVDGAPLAGGALHGELDELTGGRRRSCSTDEDYDENGKHLLLFFFL